MDNIASPFSLRDQLILAGIKELSAHGVQRFSVRRIAAECGVSCAAPYKHFCDKQHFIEAIVAFINARWDARQRAAEQRYRDYPTRRQLLEVSMEYIRFLLENPHFRSVIMMRYDDMSEDFQAQRGQVSRQTYALVSKYCEEVGMPDDVRERKTFAVRSLIYGAALMFDNGELKPTPENIEMVSRSIDREFDLP